jgi:holo-[acyl-carrier protein] synthase
VIISIGVDIIEVGRVRETIARTPRFAERVFTEAERSYANHAAPRLRNIMPRASPQKKPR